MFAAALVAALAAHATTASPLHAQAVRGRVVDDLNLVPVSTARIVLVRQAEGAGAADTTSLTDVRAATSDSLGYFGVPAPGPGTYRLRAERIGYATALSRPFRVEASEIVTVELWLQPDAVLVKPLVVTARSGLGRSEFYRRMEAWGKGVFVTPDMIDSLAPRHPAHVLEGIEEVRVSWGMGDASSGERRPMPEVRTGLGNGCMAYLVDGRPVPTPDSAAVPWAIFPLDGVRGEDIAAVEVYRYIGEAPPEFRNAAYRWDFGIPKMCGLTLFWTKQGW